MEPSGITERLRDRTVLITGATGFIAKLLVEKILRVQPRVKRLYLLVRAGDQASAEKRVGSEILQCQIFQSLQEKYQTQFTSWFWSKVFPVAGDVSLKNLGIRNADLAKDTLNESNIVIHMAATVKFRERYDTALAINTMGVKHVMDFAWRCAKLELVLLASSVVVNLDKDGIMTEKPLHHYKSFDGKLDLNISEEMAFAEAALKELVSTNASQETIARTMKKLGAERARKFGWASTYAFTKAMGEMVAYEHRSRLPIVIIRPSATISTWKEPFPGWIEGVHTIDTWVTNYGKGHMKILVGDATATIDIVRCLRILWSMQCFASSVATRKGALDMIYQIGSSTRNPLKIRELVYLMCRYFLEKPFIDEGNVVKVEHPNLQPEMVSFYELMNRHYRVPLQDMLRRGLSTTNDHNKYNQLKREYGVTIAVAEAYWPLTLFKGRFDDSNMQKLIVMMDKRDREMIPCDTKFINWEKYLMEIHIPGVMECESRIAKATRARL